MKSKLYSIVFLALTSLVTSLPTVAQTVYKPLASSKMIITGTSTLHDWESEATSITGTAKIRLDNEHDIIIDDLNVTVPVTSIKSGKDSMDKNTYNALQYEDHPSISFSLLDYTLEGEDKIKAIGKLTIAGYTKNVEMTATYQVLNENKVKFSGELPIDMTDFKIEPPTAILGTIKTGKDVIIKYDVVLGISQ